MDQFGGEIKEIDASFDLVLLRSSVCFDFTLFNTDKLVMVNVDNGLLPSQASTCISMDQMLHLFKTRQITTHHF